MKVLPRSIFQQDIQDDMNICEFVFFDFLIGNSYPDLVDLHRFSAAHQVSVVSVEVKNDGTSNRFP